jgi:hypothetical protein
MAKLVETREKTRDHYIFRWERYSDGSRVLSKCHLNGRVFRYVSFAAEEMALVAVWESQRREERDNGYDTISFDNSGLDQDI